MNTRSFIGLVLLISLFASTPQLAQEQTKKLTPGDIYKLKTVGNPEISPEGHWLLYTLTTTDSAKDNRNSDIWMTSWDGTNSVQLTNTPEGETIQNGARMVNLFRLLHPEMVVKTKFFF